MLTSTQPDVFALIEEVKLSNFGAVPPISAMSKEDQRSFELAERAQRGDYDDGEALRTIKESFG